jgi:hypothetical protein
MWSIWQPIVHEGEGEGSGRSRRMGTASWRIKIQGIAFLVSWIVGMCEK